MLSPPVRKSIKVMGAVRIGANPQWHSRFVKVFNAETFIEFLHQLHRYYRGIKIHLITDNAPYHKSPEFGSGSKARKISLNYRPPAPEAILTTWVLHTTPGDPFPSQEVMALYL